MREILLAEKLQAGERLQRVAGEPIDDASTSTLGLLQSATHDSRQAAEHRGGLISVDDSCQ